jgi:hypothetical protein
MIPSDLVARLRLLNETVVQPLAAVHEIASELPEFSLGQRFTARIDVALPDGTFRALVAGKNLTLSLPQSAKPGDTLDLVVVDRKTRLIVAQPAAEGARAEPAGASLSGANLSRAGRLIGDLLAKAGHPPAAATQFAPVGRAVSLLPQPPPGGTALASGANVAATAIPATVIPVAVSTPGAAVLAPALQQAISEGGLFYEAHQARWLAGSYPLEALLREPQARHSRGLRATAASAAVERSPEIGAEPATAGTGAETKAATAASSALRLPPDLQPLVQQQLEAAATQQIAWRGEIWPGQTLQWEIEEEDLQRQAAGGAEEPAEWKTTLRLALPQLGEVSATLRLTAAGVGISFSTAAGATAQALRARQEELASVLGAAGVPLLAMTVATNEPA